MFIETHVDTLYSDEQIALTFLKSLNVQAFPCGRRRSTVIDQDANGEIGANETTRIPFDPEARLNTEANNRKHSSLNGFTQTYLNKWDDTDKKLSISLAGYLFDITLEPEYAKASDFGNRVFEVIRDKLNTLEGFDEATFNENSRIYANILIENTQLFSGFKNYYTGMLHNQSADVLTTAVLDLLCSSINAYEEGDPTYHYYVDDPGSYYFSGLSFSVRPLTGYKETVSERYIEKNGQEIHQTIVSLCILERKRDENGGWSAWQIHEPARLPKISHGDTPDSVKIKELYVDLIRNLRAENIDVDNIKINEKASHVINGVNRSIPAITLKEQADSTYQLQLFRVDKI